MSRRMIAEEPVNHDRWLVSYADFITLLFAFFVVMYSISQVNQGKYKVLSETLAETFTADYLDTGKAPPDLSVNPIQVGEVSRSSSMNVIELEKPAADGADSGADSAAKEKEELDEKMTAELAEDQPAGQSQELAESKENTQTPPVTLPEDFTAINQKLDAVYGDLIAGDMITLRGNEEWLEIELNSSLLFDSGDAQLSNQALQVLADIAELLAVSEQPVRVEGFTDNQPIQTLQFPSNWELSTARAAAVVQLFIEEGLDAARFAATGYGEHQPIADNSTPEGRERNRRVVIMMSEDWAELRPELREMASTAQLAEQAELEALRRAEAERSQANPGIEIIIPGVNDQAPELNSADADAEALEGIKTIQLEDGGLLFTRDVDNAEPPEVE